MEESGDNIEITISLDKTIALSQFSDAIKKTRALVGATEETIKDLIKTLLTEYFSDKWKNVTYAFEQKLNERIAAWNILRDWVFTEEAIWYDDLSLDPAISDETIAKIYIRYKDHFVAPLNYNKDHFKDDFYELAKKPYETIIWLTCIPLAKKCFPIELIRELWIQEDVFSYALTVSQIEQLIKKHKVYKHGKWYNPEFSSHNSLFLVKRINHEVRIMEAYFSEQKWYYFTRPIMFNENHTTWPFAVWDNWNLFLPFVSHKAQQSALNKDKRVIKAKI